ncbi:transposase [Paenibacillus algorifonticola]
MKLKRNKHSKEFKLQVIKEALEIGNKAAVARRYEIAANMLHRWTKEYEAGKFGEESLDSVTALESKALAQENNQLKHLLGEQALEIAILRDLIKKKNPHLLTKWK